METYILKTSLMWLLCIVICILLMGIASYGIKKSTTKQPRDRNRFADASWIVFPGILALTTACYTLERFWELWEMPVDRSRGVNYAIMAVIFTLLFTHLPQYYEKVLTLLQRYGAVIHKVLHKKRKSVQIAYEDTPESPVVVDNPKVVHIQKKEGSSQVTAKPKLAVRCTYHPVFDPKLKGSLNYGKSPGDPGYINWDTHPMNDNPSNPNYDPSYKDIDGLGQKMRNAQTNMIKEDRAEDEKKRAVILAAQQKVIEGMI